MTDPHRIAFVVFDRLQSLDLSGPWEVLHTAGLRADRPYELITTARASSVRCSSGLRVAVDRPINCVSPPDTLIVAGGAGTREAVTDRELITQLLRLADGARRVCSVCSGAFLLAEAGLLDGRRAVTHWGWCDRLAELYREVEVERDPIFVRDGNILTSAGVTAGIDLALALVEEDHGPRIALQVARDLVVYARREGGQSQFSVQLSHRAASIPPIRELQAWIGENLDGDLSVGALAARLNLSERHFARLFRAEVGTSPADYVERARIERARALLEAGEGNVDTIAAASGFPSSEVMRRAFHRRLGVSPRAYRERFRLEAA